MTLHRLRALIAVALLLALIASTAPVQGTHNSAGAKVALIEADEFGDDHLQPDVAGQEIRFHTEDDLSEPRRGPPDQSGDRYTDCEREGDTSADAYRSGLETGTSCYIGYIDVQWAYVVTDYPMYQTGDDSLYRINPDPSDTACQNPQNRLDSGCSGSGHDAYQDAETLVDVDLTEPNEDLTELDSEASGSATYPVRIRPYLYLFGQPHPDTENLSELEAGSGPFGSNPAEGGSPVQDISDACGDRTLDCKLLTPEDIARYSYEDPTYTGVIRGIETEVPKPAPVCQYLPQFRVVDEHETLSERLCGEFGFRFDFTDQAAGGFGVPGSPGTYRTTLPGWYSPLTLETNGVGGTVLKYGDEVLAGDEDAEIEGLSTYAAVNPMSPTMFEGHPLWCVRPNILAKGDSAVLGAEDPGYFGTYRADAIDADLYRSPIQDELNDVAGPVSDAAGPLVEDAKEEAEFRVNDALDQVSLPPEVEEAADEAVDRFWPLERRGDESSQRDFTVRHEAGVGCRPDGTVTVFESPRRLDGGVVMDAKLDPSTVTLKDPTLFTDGLPAGESETTRADWQPDMYAVDGSLRGILDTNENGAFDACAERTGQPQPDQDVCAWEPLWDAYNPNCTVGSGDESAACDQVLRDRHYDVEEGVGLVSVWKVSGAVAVTPRPPETVDPSEIAEASAGARVDTYDLTNPDVDLDVGLEAGPVAYYAGYDGYRGLHHSPVPAPEDLVQNALDSADPDSWTDRTAVLGLDDPTAQNCVIATSTGFDEDRLERWLGADYEEDLCGDVGGEHFVVEDGFRDQDALGEFASAVAVTKVTPTPAASVDATEIGEGDEVCVHASLPVDTPSGTPYAEDTTGNVKLRDGRHVFTDCDPLVSGTS